MKSVLLIGTGLIGLGALGDGVFRARLRSVSAREGPLVSEIEVAGLLLIAAATRQLGLLP